MLVLLAFSVRGKLNPHKRVGGARFLKDESKLKN